jgi:hypothetical protein
MSVNHFKIRLMVSQETLTRPTRKRRKTARRTRKNSAALNHSFNGLLLKWN